MNDRIRPENEPAKRARRRWSEPAVRATEARARRSEGGGAACNESKSSPFERAESHAPSTRLARRTTRARGRKDSGGRVCLLRSHRPHTPPHTPGTEATKWRLRRPRATRPAARASACRASPRCGRARRRASRRRRAAAAARVARTEVYHTSWVNEWRRDPTRTTRRAASSSSQHLADIEDCAAWHEPHVVEPPDREVDEREAFPRTPLRWRALSRAQLVVRVGVTYGAARRREERTELRRVAVAAHHRHARVPPRVEIARRGVAEPSTSRRRVDRARTRGSRDLGGGHRRSARDRDVAASARDLALVSSLVSDHRSIHGRMLRLPRRTAGPDLRVALTPVAIVIAAPSV